MKRLYTNLIPGLTLFLLLLGAQPLNAADAVHKLVIQVSTDDVRTHNIAMNNAVNLQKALGQVNIIIEIVAYGPGLTMLTPKSPSRPTSRERSASVQTFHGPREIAEGAEARAEDHRVRRLPTRPDRAFCGG